MVLEDRIAAMVHALLPFVILGMTINLCDDTAVVFGRLVRLGCTSMGHYTLPISRTPSKQCIESVLMSEWNSQGRYGVALKLHRQFAHPSAEKLKKLLIDAGRNDPGLLKCIDTITDSCETCVRYKKQRPRPVVSMSMAKTFNDTLAMDLKIWKTGTYFLVLVDLATRFCRAILIHDKKAETIIHSIITHWISLFGAPRQILSDNGGEFNNDEMRAIADAFAIKLVCTAAESPWSNGVCERLNCILGVSVQKILHETQCDLSVALSWAVSARNALQN